MLLLYDYPCVLDFFNYMLFKQIGTISCTVVVMGGTGQVLHPSAMVPCIEERIPVLVKCLDKTKSLGRACIEKRGQRWTKQILVDSELCLGMIWHSKIMKYKLHEFG